MHAESALAKGRQPSPKLSVPAVDTLVNDGREVVVHVRTQRCREAPPLEADIGIQQCAVDAVVTEEQVDVVLVAG